MKWRYQAAVIFFAFIFLCIGGRLFYWQIVKADELSRLGREQYSQIVQIQPQRGDITAADAFPLVTNSLEYLVFGNPKEIMNKDATANTLSPLISVESSTISAILNADKFWVPIKSRVHTDAKLAIDALKLPGIGFQEQYGRLYPEASMAASLLGFVGKDDAGNDKGYFGLEGYYDRQLRGRAGSAVVIKDALGRPVLSKYNDDSGAQDGRSLVLTLDRTIQYQLETKLKAGIENYGAQSGMGAVMDPKTGAILAMSNFPSFDPRAFNQYDPSLYKNPFITDTYEPGSTFKPLVMAAALEEKLITPTTTCPICDKPVQVQNYEIHTWNNEYTANIDMTHIMIHSDNTGMVYISQLMGLTKMLSYFDKFGIGQDTGIDLQGEFAPPLKEERDWYPIDVATSAFGQGIVTTPIELLDAFSSIANKGVRMQPRLVSKIITPEGNSFSVEPKVVDTPLSPETARVMNEILVHSVNEGEAQFARLKGYRIAGKTGTASIPVDGHYDQNKTIASFIGYAPADDPKFIMLIILNKPTKSIYGAETAAPIFFDVAKDILDYYGIAPSGE